MTEIDGADHPAVYWAASRRCWGCGRDVKLRPEGRGDRRWPLVHRCWLHWIARRRWASYLEGWHEAHRFAVENRDDPMVLADAEDYGSGWAGIMRNGGVFTVLVDADE